MKKLNSMFIVPVFTASMLVFASCTKEQTTTAEPPLTASQTSAQAKHASAGVVPGSHEDWCGEHQVPESQCTRCNPKLIAAFKATNDWCAEHGLPESQCLLCNLDLKIQRPPKKEGAQ